MKTTQILEDQQAQNQGRLLDIIHKQECIISELRDENDGLLFENEELKEKIKTSSSVKEGKKEKINPDYSKLLTKLTDEVGVIQYERDGAISKTEEKHLRVQAVGLALCILSGNKIGIEDICRHPAMVNLNPWYFQSGALKKLNLPKQLLREIVPLKVRTKGRKKKGILLIS